MSRMPSDSSPATRRSQSRWFPRPRPPTPEDHSGGETEDSDASPYPPGYLPEVDDANLDLDHLEASREAERSHTTSPYPSPLADQLNDTDTDDADSFTPPGDLSEGYISYLEAPQEETPSEPPISNGPSPYPSPPGVLDELLLLPLQPLIPSLSLTRESLPTSPNLGAHSRSPSCRSLTSLCSDDSDDFENGPSPLYSKMSATEYATITGVNRAKDCPILTEGTVTPHVMLAWGRACTRYYSLNKAQLEQAVAVSHVGGSVRENYISDWFALEEDRLCDGGMDVYLAELAKLVLPRNWANQIREQLLSSRQPADTPFSKWRIEMMNLNSILSMSDKITPLDNVALRAQLTANLCPDLRQYLANEPLDNIDSFVDWSLAVTEVDDKLCLERARTTRAATKAFADWSGQGGKKKPLAERLGTAATPATPSSTAASSANRKFMKKLTESEKKILDGHSGCRRCRKMYVDHMSDKCPMAATNTWPDPDAVVPITDAAAAAGDLRRARARLVRGFLARAVDQDRAVRWHRAPAGLDGGHVRQRAHGERLPHGEGCPHPLGRARRLAPRGSDAHGGHEGAGRRAPARVRASSDGGRDR